MNIQALMAAGYTAKQALNYLSKVYPALSGRIQTAAHAGYAADKILNIIGKHGAKSLKQFAKGKAESPPYADEQSQNPLIRGAEANRKTTEYNKRNNPALRTGQALGSAAAAYALSRSAPQAPEHAGAGSQVLHGQVLGAQQELPFHQKRIASQSSSQLPGQPQLGYDPQQQQPQEHPPQQPSPPIPPQQNVNPVEPVQEKPVLPRASEIFEGMGIAESLRNIIKGESGSIGGAKEKITPRDAAAVLNFTLKGPQKQWLNSQKEPLENMVSRFMQEEAEEPKEPPPVEQVAEKPFTKPQPALNPIEPQPKKQEESVKNKSVMLPNGSIGSVLSEKGGIAKIEVDGQVKHRKPSEFVESPVRKKDVADIYEELIQAIPEHARSSVINFAGYDPNVNELAFRPHSGAMYVYKNIPPEYAEKLKNAMFKAKTSGENFYGSWEQGKDSRFAGLSQLIRELQKLYGGKGKEYVRKYETVYDFFGVPEQAKKDKLKQQSQERKDAKRKAKK